MFSIPLLFVCALAVTAPVAQGAASPDKDLPELVAGNNAFVLDLYAQLSDEPGNLLLSPFSVSAALAMAYGGARGETAEEMARVLRFTVEPLKLHETMGALLTRLRASGESPGHQLRIANALWSDQSLSLLPTFTQLCRQHYQAEPREVDFGDLNAAVRTINGWVSDVTSGKIERLVTPDLLASAVLVLTNAIHFDGTWKTQFDESRTFDAPFTVSPDRRVTVKMMAQNGRAGHARVGPVELLELPYAGDELSMVILLPARADGLRDLEESLTIGKLKGWLGMLREQEMAFMLPRFELTSRFRLADVLQRMGIRLAFSRAADFSGISDGTLFISQVVHQTCINVDEQGTEAAAATAVILKRGAVFRADHPFLFLIRDRSTGSIIFIGRVVDPTDSGPDRSS